MENTRLRWTSNSIFKYSNSAFFLNSSVIESHLNKYYFALLSFLFVVEIFLPLTFLSLASFHSVQFRQGHFSLAQAFIIIFKRILFCCFSCLLSCFYLFIFGKISLGTYPGFIFLWHKFLQIFIFLIFVGLFFLLFFQYSCYSKVSNQLITISIGLFYFRPSHDGSDGIS